MISVIGLLDGITATIIIVGAVALGLLSVYNGKRLKSNLITSSGFMMIFVGFLWLRPFTEFLSVLFVGRNLNPAYIYGYLSYAWVAPAIIAAMYLGGEIILPKRKWILVGIFAVLGVIFELFLFLDTPNTFEGFTVNNPGDLLDASFKRQSFAFILIAIFLVSTLILLGIGFLVKAQQAPSGVNKRFRFLSLGVFTFVIGAALDSIIPVGVAIGIIRIITVSSAFWMYFGLKP
ncbi:MAG: hypothetical protein ACFFAH_16720 [Promethearchaeota archaeon]